MPTYSVQFRRGTAVEHETFIGAQGEITVVTDDSTLRLHDGTTPGGHALADASNILTDISQYTDANGVLTGLAEIASGVTVLDDESIYGDYVEAIIASNSAGTSVDDKTGFSAITNSGVTASNSVTKFADYSLYFDGASYLELPHAVEDPDLQFGGIKPFTIEAWVYPTNSTSPGVIVAVDDSTSSRQGFSLFRKTDGTIQFIGFTNFKRSSNVTLNSTSVVVNNAWTHIAVTFNGNNIKLFINGTVEDSQSVNPRLYPSTQNLTIGGYAGGTGNDKFVGYIDDVRVTNGVTRYTEDFNVPTNVLVHVSPSGASAGWYGSRAVISAANLDYYNISTPGSAVQVFGTGGRWYQSGLSNSTYGVFAGGSGSPPSSVIDYVTIAVTSNASSFGSLTVGREKLAAASNGSRGLFLGGKDNWVGTNIIDYITIDTPDNATDFGDLLTTRHWGMAAGDSTNAIHIGGFGPGNTPEIYYVTFDTLGSCSDWGSVPSGLRATGGAVTNGERVVYSAGFITDRSDVIEYFTNTVGSSVSNFGNLTLTRQHQAAVTDGTYATFNGGSQGEFPFEVNTIDYVTIATTGPATDFGDLTTKPQNPGAASGSPS